MVSGVTRRTKLGMCASGGEWMEVDSTTEGAAGVTVHAGERQSRGARQRFFGSVTDRRGSGALARHSDDFHLTPVVRKFFPTIQTNDIGSGNSSGHIAPLVGLGRNGETVIFV